MSRRRPTNVHRGYAIVRLKCPAGHVVGGIYERPSGGYIELDKTLRRGRPRSSTDNLRYVCDRCAAEGRRPDLQGSWPKIRVLLAEIDADPDRGRVDYVLGG